MPSVMTHSGHPGGANVMSRVLDLTDHSAPELLGDQLCTGQPVDRRRLRRPRGRRRRSDLAARFLPTTGRPTAAAAALASPRLPEAQRRPVVTGRPALARGRAAMLTEGSSTATTVRSRPTTSISGLPHDLVVTAL